MCFSNFLLSLTLWTKNHYSIISLVYQFLTYPVLTPSLFHLQCTLMQFHKTSSSDNFTKNVNISIRSVCQLCFWRFSIIYRMRAIITRSLYNSYPIFLFHCGLYYRPFMYILETEILHFLSLKSAVSAQEWLLIKSGL